MKRKKGWQKSCFVLFMSQTQIKYFVMKKILDSIFFGILIFYLAVPPNLFLGLHVQDPISGLHINTFDRSILYKYPSIVLLG